MNPDSVIQFLRAERKRKKKSQWEMAEEIGVHTNTVYRMESVGDCGLGTALKIIGTMWDDLTSFAEDYEYWTQNKEDDTP